MRTLVPLLLALAAGAAQAHAYLQRSESPAHADIAQPPRELRMRFSEPVEPSFVEVSVLRDGKPVVVSAPLVSDGGRVVKVGVGGGEAGTWSVQWRLIAKDGHRTQGKFEFAVRPR